MSGENRSARRSLMSRFWIGSLLLAGVSLAYAASPLRNQRLFGGTAGEAAGARVSAAIPPQAVVTIADSLTRKPRTCN